MDLFTVNSGDEFTKLGENQSSNFYYQIDKIGMFIFEATDDLI